MTSYNILHINNTKGQFFFFLTICGMKNLTSNFEIDSVIKHYINWVRLIWVIYNWFIKNVGTCILYMLLFYIINNKRNEIWVA